MVIYQCLNLLSMQVARIGAVTTPECFRSHMSRSVRCCCLYNYDVRLVGGNRRCAGRVEVFHNEEWGTVCDDFWNMKVAALVCRELGCGEAVDAWAASHFGPGVGPIWMRYLDCTGKTTLKKCGQLGAHVLQCNHDEDVGVICSEVKLVGGPHCSGRVEVLHEKTWATVCDADFDKKDAEVVCREMGCGPPKQILGAAAFGRGEGQVWRKRLLCKGTESYIHFCPKPIHEHNCTHYNDVGLVCSDNVMLADGGSRCAGRVKVFHREKWGRVCSNNWNFKAAAVVCRELGCGVAVDVLHDSDFGLGSEAIWMDEVNCMGTESTLKNCGSAKINNSICNYRDAGVICSEVRLVGASRCSGRVEVLHELTWFKVCAADFSMRDAEVVCRELDCGPPLQVLGAASFGVDEVQEQTMKLQCRVSCAELVKLVDGGSQCAGRVEVFYRKKWGTVDKEYFNEKVATLLCKELGCSEFIDIPPNAHFGLGTGPVWMVVPDCSGSEDTLKDCLTGEWGENDFGHDSDAGLVCSGVRLVNGSHCSGRVEVLHGKTWATVCGATFDQQDAEVVCRELGCASPEELLGADAFGSGEGPVWEKEFQCRGTEPQTHFCPTSSLEHNCSHSSDAGLVCAAGVRLVDGGSRCAGRVAVIHRGSWGTVCVDSWDMRDATVVCKELGCGEAENTFDNIQFGPESGPVLMNVHCTGLESSLKDCESSPLSGDKCIHGGVPAVICSLHREPRLMDGPHLCSGRAEVLVGNTWAQVCDAEFDQQDAEVVCRELGCGIPVQVVGAFAFGKGKSQVWMKDLQCRGNESQIYFCQGSFKLKENCSHEHYVGLICSGYTDARLMKGMDSCSGRVELKYLNTWGSVCALNWNMRAANVLCRQLNCGSAVTVVEADLFNAEKVQMWEDMFDCQGNETHMSQCPILSWSRAACSQDAGVICNDSSLSLHEDKVRLSGGSKCQGELEVYFKKNWTRVLFHSFGLSEASVVCRQLGCGSVLSYNSSLVKTEHSHMCVEGFKCSGNEAHLMSCASAEEVKCSSGEQLAITCSDVFNHAHSSIRLVGSGGDNCAGRLEVLHNGSWGTVRHDLWDIKDAQVVCRQLRCGIALRDHFLSWFGPGTGPIWLNRVECTGKEEALWDCQFQFSEEEERGHQDDVGVVCSEFKEFRLTEGCTGNLEVFYNGTWGNVCENAVDDGTASLICRELNCGTMGTEHWSKARLKFDWLDDLKCRKHDATLWHCPSSPWSNKVCLNRAAHITCRDVEKNYKRQHRLRGPVSKHLPLRLSGGKGHCSGRLELYYNATWGTVCSDQWDINDAKVVCRQLGCGQAMRADRTTMVGAGRGVIWLNRVNCRGNEIHLMDCLHSLKNHTDCFQRQAGVTCADMPTPPSVTTTTTTMTKKERDTTLTALSQRHPALAMFVLGALLFMALLLVVIFLFYQNKQLRNALDKRRYNSYSDAVYEDININFSTSRATTLPQREAEHSGYEYVDEALDSESYDDVVTAGLMLEDADDISENYDDAIPTGITPNIAVETPEDYDDVIIAGQDAEDYDDVEELPKN
ncbi:deleted in malignant brain tumors 1 protein-like [Tachysurus fulvidraco]|uniref:deleted in malignant brain tumors 1 protein-like n=1 Tax=Tachysurus fulvidraco TaxID=1234273 RepID=UPI001FEF05E2|nr:deleted in malignant brain tumors 1 protein-like [Tachysurus fulvidraco]